MTLILGGLIILLEKKLAQFEHKYLQK